MATKEKKYGYIRKLIDKVTTSPSNNMCFPYYRHLVELTSGTNGYVSVTIYNTEDRYDGEMADFSFDYWTHKLYIWFGESETLIEKIISAFKSIYASQDVTVAIDEQGQD